MYLLTSTCPVCGAPIFVGTLSHDGSQAIVDLATGLWHAIPAVQYTCDCHLPPTAPATPRPPAHNDKRASGRYEGLRPSFGVGTRKGH